MAKAPSPPSPPNPACPRCESVRTRKRGYLRGKQQYSCNTCGHYWRGGDLVSRANIPMSEAEAMTLGLAWYAREGRAPRAEDLADAGLPTYPVMQVLFTSLRTFQRAVARAAEQYEADEPPRQRYIHRPCMRCDAMFLPTYRFNTICRRCAASPYDDDDGEWMTGGTVMTQAGTLGRIRP